MFVLILVFALIPTLSGSSLSLPYRLFAVESGSMRPIIKQGDLIAVKTTESTYQVGDIITFRFSNGTNTMNNTHRIVEIRTNSRGETEYITKGDFNSVTDAEPVTQDRIVGKYVAGIPFLGYPILFVQTVPGLILLIVIPATILVYEEINNIKGELSKRRRYTQAEKKYQK